MSAPRASFRAALTGWVWCVALGIGLTSGCGGLPAQAMDRIAWLRDLGLGQGIPLVVLPPGAGAIIGVDEQRKTDSFTQTITLAGDAGTVGDNQIVVTVTRNGLAPRIEDDTVASEAQEELPNFSYTLGPIGTRNAFGPFGALMGGRGGVNCLYAWQGVNLADAWITGTPANALEERHAMTMRYRLCRTTATSDELLGFIQGGQSGLVATRIQPRPTPGYDALSAATSLTSAAMTDRAPVQVAPMIAPIDTDHRRYGLPRARRVVRRTVQSRAATSAENMLPQAVAAPDVPLP